MFNSQDFNKNNLFQKFNGWYEGAVEKFNDEWKDTKIENIDETTREFIKLRESFENLLVHANSILISLNQIRVIEKKVIQHFNLIKDQLELSENKIIIYSPLIVDILGKISAVLSSLVFIQDRIIRLVGKELQLTIPNSMRRVIKASIETYKLPVNYYRIIRRYWSHSGKRIRDYRDVDQHHFVLTSNVSLVLKPESKILVMFPDNPEVKKIEFLEFKKEYDAISFLEKSFIEIHNFIEEIAGAFGYKEKKFAQGINLNTVGDLEGKSGTIAVMFENLKLMRGLSIYFKDGKLIIRPFQLN